MLLTGEKNPPKKTTLNKKAVRWLLTLSDTVRPALRSASQRSAAAVQTDARANVQTFLPTGEFAQRLPGLLFYPAFIFWVIPEGRSGGHSPGFLIKRQIPLCSLLGEGKQSTKAVDVTQRCAAETMEIVAETGSKEKCTAVYSRHVLEMWAWTRKRADVDLIKADIDGNSVAACIYSIMVVKLCFRCFHSDE